MTTSPSYLGCKLYWQMLHMQRRCTIEQSLCMSLVLPRTFLMAPIINLYLTPSSLVRPTTFPTFQMNMTLPWAFQQMALVHSRGARRHVGLLFFSTTTSPLKFVSRRRIASMSPWSQVQKSLGIGIHSVGHSIKN